MLGSVDPWEGQLIQDSTDPMPKDHETPYQSRLIILSSGKRFSTNNLLKLYVKQTLIIAQTWLTLSKIVCTIVVPYSSSYT